MQTKNKTKKSDFRATVEKIVKAIPKGKTLSYKEVAKKAKNPLAARAVAQIMAKNFDLSIPCHRVIKSDGSLGGYNRGGSTEKYQKLTEEGWRQKA